MEWHSQTLHEAESLRQELARSELTLRENERAIAEAHLLREDRISWGFWLEGLFLESFSDRLRREDHIPSKPMAKGRGGHY